MKLCPASQNDNRLYRPRDYQQTHITGLETNIKILKYKKKTSVKSHLVMAFICKHEYSQYPITIRCIRVRSFQKYKRCNFFGSINRIRGENPSITCRQHRVQFSSWKPRWRPPMMLCIQWRQTVIFPLQSINPRKLDWHVWSLK